MQDVKLTMNRFVLADDLVIFTGFKAVELGADVLDECSVEQLVTVKEAANVLVVGLCAQLGVYVY